MEKKSAFVTGGSRGIGKAISLRLASNGFHVIINYRSNDQEAEATLAEIKNAGGSAELLKFDVTDRKTALTECERIAERSTIEALVLSAGIHSDALLIFMSEEQWDSVIDVNLKSFYGVVKPIIKQMMLNRKGSVVAISSTSGESGLAGQVNYSAAKAGLIGAVKSLAIESAKRNITVNAITPGFIKTDMTDEIDPKRIKATVPLAREGKPEEVAALVSFLTSSEASYITGQTIGINGGVYM